MIDKFGPRVEPWNYAPMGVTTKHLPETKRGLVESCNRKKIKILCPVCKEPKSIAACISIFEELDKKVVYLVRLECEHDRHFEQSIARTPKGRAKLAESRARAEIARLSEGDGNAEQISIEVPALDSETEEDVPDQPQSNQIGHQHGREQSQLLVFRTGCEEGVHGFQTIWEFSRQRVGFEDHANGRGTSKNRAIRDGDS